MNQPECQCGAEMEETGDGITFSDIVTIVWKCQDCGRTVEKEFHPIKELWSDPEVEE